MDWAKELGPVFKEAEKAARSAGCSPVDFICWAVSSGVSERERLSKLNGAGWMLKIPMTAADMQKVIEKSNAPDEFARQAVAEKLVREEGRGPARCGLDDQLTQVEVNALLLVDRIYQAARERRFWDATCEFPGLIELLKRNPAFHAEAEAAQKIWEGSRVFEGLGERLGRWSLTPGQGLPNCPQSKSDGEAA